MILTRYGEAADKLIRTLQLIGAIGAELALAADTGYPLNTNSIALFPRVLNAVPDCGYYTSSLVA